MAACREYSLSPENIIATFSDDMAVLSVPETVTQLTAKLKETVYHIIMWPKK